MSEQTEQTAEEFWEDRYGSSDQVWSGRPNAHLVTVAEPLVPGTALDLGCGEGGDALWLAERGWRVTAVDISAIALARLADRAATAGLAVATERHDLARTFPEGAFDLVSAQFLQSPVTFPRDDVLRRATRAVAPGGLLLVVAHLTVPPWAAPPPADPPGTAPGRPDVPNPDQQPDPGPGHGHGHGHGPDWRFPTAEETLTELRRAPDWDEDAWTVQRAGAAERTVTGPAGETATISDSLLALRRRS